MIFDLMLYFFDKNVGRSLYNINRVLPLPRSIRPIRFASAVLLYRTRIAEITWETLSVIGLILSRVRHVGRDVDRSNNRWNRSRFGDDGAAITVSHKNAWSILQS